MGRGIGQLFPLIMRAGNHPAGRHHHRSHRNFVLCRGGPRLVKRQTHPAVVHRLAEHFKGIHEDLREARERGHRPEWTAEAAGGGRPYDFTTAAPGGQPGGRRLAVRAVRLA